MEYEIYYPNMHDKKKLQKLQGNNLINYRIQSIGKCDKQITQARSKEIKRGLLRQM